MIVSHDLIPLVPAALGDTDLPLPGKRSGKVRDWYPLADQKRLIVTTDRLSALDIVLGRVPYKGQVLNQLTNWWMHRTDDLLANHLIAESDPNAVIVQEAEPFLVEVIVRGYITGVTSTALWYRYSLGECNIYGYTFSKGLRKNQALPEPIITPTTKGGATGHDERLTCAEVVEKRLLDEKTWGQVQTAEYVLNILAEYEADPRPKVYIAVAGRSTALSGFTDGAVLRPGNCLPAPERCLWWSGCVFIAALLAAKILGLADPSLRKAVVLYQQKQAGKITDDDAALHQQG